MKIHPNEMMVCYNPTSPTDKKTLAYAKGISNHIHEVDYTHEKFTMTMWRDLLKQLEMEPKEILNKSDPKYQKEISGRDFNMEGWLEIIINNPTMIKGAIVVWRNKAKLCTNPSDIMKL